MCVNSCVFYSEMTEILKNAGTSYRLTFETGSFLILFLTDSVAVPLEILKLLSGLLKFWQ